MLLEVWNDSKPLKLESATMFDSAAPGYDSGWVGQASMRWPNKHLFTARFTGFFVPPLSQFYTFYIRGDDKFLLFMSTSGRPEDKVLFVRGELTFHQICDSIMHTHTPLMLNENLSTTQKLIKKNEKKK